MGNTCARVGHPILHILGIPANDLPTTNDTHAVEVPISDTVDSVSGAVGLLSAGCRG